MYCENAIRLLESEIKRTENCREDKLCNECIGGNCEHEYNEMKKELKHLKGEK